MRYSNTFSAMQFKELLTEAKQTWSSVGACNGKGTKSPILSKVVFPYFNPKDDYLVGEDAFVWFGIPLAANNNYGRRLPFALIGKNISSVFEILSAHESARKECETYKKNKAMGNSEISDYLSQEYQCPDCRGGVKPLKTKNGKYILVCRKCGECIIPYVPYKSIEDFMADKDIRCSECGALLKISKYGKPYCSNDWGHNCGTTIEDIYS